MRIRQEESVFVIYLSDVYQQHYFGGILIIKPFDFYLIQK